MITKHWDVTDQQMNHQQAIKEAARLLSQGEVVAFPTETVYGLGADATNEQAVTKIFQAKGRPQDNPLIVHVSSKQQIMRLVSSMPVYAERLIEAFMPGPLTLVLPSNGVCATNVTAGLSTIAVRIPDHPAAQQLLKKCNLPIAAPSANLSGKPSPTTAKHVSDDLYGKISGILDGGPTGVGMESTVIDCTRQIPMILRPGGITKEQIIQIAGKVKEDPALENTQDRPISPGLKYKHYAPDVPLILVKGTVKDMQQAINFNQENGLRVGVLARTFLTDQLQANQIFSLGEDLHEVAMHLYDGLRAFQSSKVDLMICESFSEKGIGQAIMNRLKKASQNE